MHLASFSRSRTSALIALTLVAIGGACSSSGSSSAAAPSSDVTTTSAAASTTTSAPATNAGATVDVTATGALKFHLTGTTAECRASNSGLNGQPVISITLDKGAYPQVGSVLQMDNEIIKWIGPNDVSYGGSASPDAFKQNPISVTLTNVQMTSGTGTVTLNGSVVCAN